MEMKDFRLFYKYSNWGTTNAPKLVILHCPVINIPQHALKRRIHALKRICASMIVWYYWTFANSIIIIEEFWTYIGNGESITCCCLPASKQLKSSIYCQNGDVILPNPARYLTMVYHLCPHWRVVSRNLYNISHGKQTFLD